MASKFRGPGKMAKRFYEVGADYIRRKRPFDDERIGVPADEAAWATSRKRAEALFFWHRNHGLARREPHPMGKNLDELQAAYNAYHAERYRCSGMEVPGCYLPPETPAAQDETTQPVGCSAVPRPNDHQRMTNTSNHLPQAGGE